jgi:hypothetical protein
MRDAFASVNLIETFLYRRHKLNVLGDLLCKRVTNSRKKSGLAKAMFRVDSVL